MRDQAERLRQIAAQFHLKDNRVVMSPIIKSDPISASSSSQTEPTQTGPRIITITSGKGGVGKTNLTVNIALALAQAGKRTILMDADLGLGNVDVVLGMIPQHTLKDVIEGSRTIGQIISPGPLGLSILAGGSGVTDLADLAECELQRFIRGLGELDQLADYILIDTGAGIAKTVMGFVLAAHETIVITTPEPTAITDAYAMVKVIHGHRPEMTVRLLVNRVSGLREAMEVQGKMNSVTERFLGIRLTLLGFVPDDSAVTRAVMAQEPFLTRYPHSGVSRSVQDVAQQLINSEAPPRAMQGTASFFARVISLFRQ